MAEVRLGKFEIEAGRLPKVCIRCGEPATVQKKKKFQWNPEWVTALIIFGPVIVIVLGMILAKRMTVKVPLCYDHRNHWLSRALAIYLSFAAMASVGFAFLVWATTTKEHRAGDDPWLGALCVGFSVAFVAWLIMVAILQNTAIRPKEITDKSITLRGVSRDFVTALLERRKRTNADDGDASPPKRRKPRVEVDDSEFEEDD